MNQDNPFEERIRALLPPGQEHILEHVSMLGDTERDNFITELEDIDWDSFSKVALKPDVSALRPPSVLSLAERSEYEAVYIERGEGLFSDASVANLIVAGGQGSRLGFEGPKGCYYLEDLGKTIFQIHAERHGKVQERYGVELPLLLMTGGHNHRETIEYFEANQYFGLNSANVHFFMQGSVPSFSPDMKLQLAERGSLLENPNGHGGAVEALIESGLLGTLHASGIQYINYIQVDNVLASLDDAFAIGLTAERDADLLTKVVEKAAPEEKVGCLVNSAGVDQIVEYSDVTPEQTRMTDDHGDLVLRWGNTAMHVLSVAFLERYESELSLPFHVSAPKAARIFQNGEFVESEVIKYERFIFDLLLDTRASIGLEVKREMEFAPIKNATGNDSPETAVALYKAVKF